MTQQEIQERNKQIALMMGAIDYKADKWYKLGGYKEHIYFPNWNYPNRFLEKDLKFHSDWNWLMEAIQFLKKHFESKDRYWTTIEIYPLYSNIEDVFIVVSDFAKLYNNKEL
jgi:predicted FMN-binding regulatory protein PaiB